MKERKEDSRAADLRSCVTRQVVRPGPLFSIPFLPLSVINLTVSVDAKRHERKGRPQSLRPQELCDQAREVGLGFRSLSHFP